jgi:hypothetical protein
MQPNPIDLNKLLTYFQDLFAHAATLQDLIQTDDKRTYEQIRPMYDLQAEQEFASFYRALNEPQAFSKAVSEFLSAHPKGRPN